MLPVIVPRRLEVKFGVTGFSASLDGLYFVAEVLSFHRDAVMEIRIRRVRRSWVERLFLWERAYEAQAERDHERIVERAKTAEAAEALVFKRMTESEIQVEVRGDLIIVTQPSTQFFAVYIRPTNQPQLILKRRTDTDDHVLLAQVSQAANAKARELGWIREGTDLGLLDIAIVARGQGASCAFKCFGARDEWPHRFTVGGRSSIVRQNQPLSCQNTSTVL